MCRARGIATLAALLATAGVWGGDEPGSPRTFRMGFTGFPHAVSLPAVAEARRFNREHGDLIAHHVEGVPWAECLEGEPFSRALLDEYRGKREATPDNGFVYLAISPGRGTLKAGEKSRPIPTQLAGKAYDDPEVARAYLEYARRMIALFQPDALAIGIEVNEIVDAGPEAWRGYAELHRRTYRALKADHPDLPIFATFTLHGLLNADADGRARQLAALHEIEAENDWVAVSFYPFIRGGTTDVAGCLQALDEHFGARGKPIAFAECGEPAQRLDLGGGTVIDGTPARQAAALGAILDYADARSATMVVWFIHRDYDALWQTIRGTAPAAFQAWQDCGLVDEAGAPRPALEIWDRARRRPHRASVAGDGASP